MAISYNDYKKEWKNGIGKEINRINSGNLTAEEKRQRAIQTSMPFPVSPKINLQEKKKELEEAREASVKARAEALQSELNKRGYKSLNPIVPYDPSVKLSRQSVEENKKRLNVQKEITPIFAAVNENTKETANRLNKATNDLRLAQYQYDVDRVNNEETNLWDKTGGNITRALADIGSIFTAGSNKYIDENGNELYLPSYNKLKQEKVRQDYDTGVGRFLGDVAYNSTKILASTGMNIVAPGSGTALYWSDMFADNLENARAQGYDGTNAIAYSALGTGMEYLTGKFLGSATKGLTGGQASTLEQGLGKAFNKVIKNENITKFLASAGSEATEEFLQEYLDNLNRLIVLDKKSPIDALGSTLFNPDVLSDALYSAAVGAASGGALSFANGNSLNNNIENNYTSNYNINKGSDSLNEQGTRQNRFINYDGRTNGNLLQRLDNATNDANEQSKRQFTREEYRQFEEEAINTRKTDFTPIEQKIVNEIRDNFNKEVIFFDSTKTKHNGGASLEFSDKIYVPYNVSDDIKSFITYHEILESNIAHNKNLKNSYIDIAVNEILNDPGFKKTKDNFTKGQPGLDKISERLIAKDIICDLYAQKNTNVPIDYNIELSNTTMDVIEYNLEMFNSKLQRNNDIKKQRVNGQRLQLPNSKNSFSNGNDTINTSKGPVAPLPSQYNMQQTEQNDTSKNNAAQLLEKRPVMAKPSAKDNYHTFIREMVDKGEAINRLSKKANNNELYAKYDHMGTSEAEGHYAIAIAQTDNNGNKIGKSVIEIWKPVEDAGLVEEFSNYLLHKHNISRWKQGKPVFGENVTSDMSEEFVKKSEKEYHQFKEWSKDINTYNKNQMQNMVDAGLTSKESQEYLNNTYDNYIRIYRDVRGSNPITQFRGNLKVNSPIKKAKGGNQNILPLKDSMAQQTIEIKKAIRRNEFGLELLSILDNGENVEYDGKQTVVKNDDGTFSFTVFKDGQPIKMEIDEGIYEAIKPSEIKNPKLLAPVRTLSKIQRGLLTDKNPLFIATNFFKDIGDAPFNSKYSSKFAKNYVVAAKEMAKNSDLWNKYKALGGEQNTYFDYETGVKVPSKSKIRKFIGKIESINHIVEQLPRFTEFISTLEAGGTEAQAMYNAAEVTTNFKRGGDLAKALNRNGANFLNASIQGFDKQIRNLSGQNGIKGYVNLLAKATILGVMPSVLNHLLLDDDEEYEDLPDYIKDTYYLFKTGNGEFIRIPKGRVVSIFGMAARRTLEYADGEKDAYDGMLTQMANQVAPNNPLEDNVLAPLLAIKNNRSWNGSEIVPQRLQNELPENQYDEKTDSISKFIGKTFKVSPKKVNYLLDQYTGGIGDVLLPILSPEANQDPISAKFTTNSIMNNKNVSDFYDIKDKLTKQSNSLNATDEDILKTKFINSMGSKMNELYKKKREIQNSSLSNKEKLSKVKEIQKEINNIAKFSLEDYETVHIDGNYAAVGELEFYKGTNGEWTKASNDMIEKQNNVSAKYDITASDFYNNREEYTYAYNNPEKYALITQITTYVKYQEYSQELEMIRSNAKDKKSATIKYVNSLPLSIPKKAMMIKSYYSSYDSYNNQIVQYINSQNITKADKETILKKLGFTIKNGKVYY